jgi:hypothetical protein
MDLENKIVDELAKYFIMKLLIVLLQLVIYFMTNF